MSKYYVTTAIDYVNAAPHIGHALEKIAADILARYYRLKGKDVFFLTGVDEHGSKVEKAAKTQGLEPQAFCDQMALKFQDAWKQLNLSYDRFIRTTDEKHCLAVQGLFQLLKSKGDIYKNTYRGLYCEGCEDFVRERDLDEDGNCPNHKQPPFMCLEENYFFKLTKYKDKLRKWLNDNPDVLIPDGRRKEVLNQLEDEDFGDFSVTRARSSLSWGIPVPEEPDQVVYVWIDALSNYLTGVGYGDNQQQFEKYWPADLHLIGKDITKFHAIYWPAMLMAADLPLPKRISVHGFLTVEGQKISKSLGNVIDPKQLVERFGADAVRFYLFAAAPFEKDGDFSHEDFVNKVNAELANNLGNLLNRTLTLVGRNCEGKVPAGQFENNLREVSNEIHAVVEKHIAQCEFTKAIEAIFALVDQANKYMNDEKPWTLFKEGNTQQGNTVLYTVLDILRRTAIEIYPFTPALAQNIWHQLGFDGKLDELRGDSAWDLIPAGQAIRNEGPIFKRIEEEVVA